MKSLNAKTWPNLRAKAMDSNSFSILMFFLQSTPEEYPKKALPYLCAEAFAYSKAVKKPYLFERVCASYRALGFGSKNEDKRTERQKSPFGYFWGYQK